MNLDLEEDFKNQRWKLLALVDGRRNLSDGSEGAMKTDLEIIVTRNAIRGYETLKGYWSQKTPREGSASTALAAQLECGELSRTPRSASRTKNVESQTDIP
jgi:hypothetical protein